MLFSGARGAWYILWFIFCGVCLLAPSLVTSSSFSPDRYHSLHHPYAANHIHHSDTYRRASLAFLHLLEAAATAVADQQSEAAAGGASALRERAAAAAELRAMRQQVEDAR